MPGDDPIQDIVFTSISRDRSCIFLQLELIRQQFVVSASSKVFEMPGPNTVDQSAQKILELNLENQEMRFDDCRPYDLMHVCAIGVNRIADYILVARGIDPPRGNVRQG